MTFMKIKQASFPQQKLTSTLVYEIESVTRLPHVITIDGSSVKCGFQNDSFRSAFPPHISILNSINQ